MTKTLIINNSERNNKEFSYRIEHILSYAGYLFQTIGYLDQEKIDHNEFDKIILTGSPKGNDIVSHHLPFFRWISEFKKPILGICAGHHIIGTLYGAKLYRSKEPEYGYFYNYIKNKDPLFYGMPDKFLSRQMHNDSISLPDNFTLLVSSEKCRNQAMHHNLRPIYSLQFHPEYINKELIINFITRI